MPAPAVVPASAGTLTFDAGIPASCRLFTEEAWDELTARNGIGTPALSVTRHWKPLVNGYSGLTPRSYRFTNATLAQFPDEASFALLRSLRVSHVVLHTDLIAPTMREAIETRTDLRTYAESGPIRIVTLP